MAATQTHKRKIDLQTARIRARMLRDTLFPYCEDERCVIAGSIRRKASTVGDIEIVCIPRWGQATTPGEMFPKHQNLVANYLYKQDLNKHGIKILKGGNRYHKIIFGDIQADIFMTNQQQWGRMLALRTGPDSYSKKLACRWVQMGYKGYEGELIRMRQDEYGNLTEPLRDKNNDFIKPEFPTERAFFDFLGWDYIEPENRG